MVEMVDELNIKVILEFVCTITILLRFHPREDISVKITVIAV